MEIPDDYELIALFESEPITFDDEIPWYYNTLVFKLLREEFILEVSIQPSYSSMNIRISNTNQGTILDLVFDDIKEIETYKEASSEGLLMILDEDTSSVTLRLETKPHFRLISTGDKNFRK